MRSFLLKVNGQLHCSSGISRPKRGDWKDETIQLYHKGPILPQSGKSQSAPEIERGDRLWIWTHEGEENGKGAGLVARATAGERFEAGENPHVRLHDVSILPFSIGKAMYKSLPTTVDALDYVLGNESKNGFNHHRTYLLTPEDNDSLFALVDDRERPMRERERANEEQEWAEALKARENGETPATDRARRQAHTRPGQSDFRRQVLDLYRGHCLLTGCIIPSALEAAHVVSHNGDAFWDQPKNGIPLRRDLHGMFDALLWSIDPATNKIVLSESLVESLSDHDHYLSMHGITVAHRIPKPALKHRFSLFLAAQRPCGSS